MQSDRTFNDLRASFFLPREVIAWAREQFGNQLVMTSSFSTYSAVLLDLVHQNARGTPVIFIDHPYLLEDTRTYAQSMQRLLGFPLHVFSSLGQRSDEEYEALLTDDPDHRQKKLIARAKDIHKREPLHRALQAFSARAWIAGLRRDESPERRNLDVITSRPDSPLNIYPLVITREDECRAYMQERGLPYPAASYDIFKGPGQNKECGMHGFK